MSATLVVSIVLGFVVPGVISLLKNVAWPKWKRVALAGVVSLVAAAGNMFVEGKLTHFGDLFEHAAVIWAVATANYKLWFGNTDLNVKLEAMSVGNFTS